jgi:serine/threonine-protein kinase
MDKTTSAVQSELTPGGTALGDRYGIERELGRGGMATVYLARDLREDRLVAVKLLLPELSASVGADRFVREIEVGRTLLHPGIVGVLDSGDANGQLYYVMPFVEGQSLRDRLNREQQLGIEDAIRIASEVAEALAVDAGRGVNHPYIQH